MSWSAEEVKTAAAIWAEFGDKESPSYTLQRISDATGRSVGAIATRRHRYTNNFNSLREYYQWDVRRDRMTDDQRATAAQRQRERRRGLARKIIREDVKSDGRAPAEVLAERDRALSAGYRDYTAAHLGDPLVGRSALDRR